MDSFTWSGENRAEAWDFFTQAHDCTRLPGDSPRRLATVNVIGPVADRGMVLVASGDCCRFGSHVIAYPGSVITFNGRDFNVTGGQ